MGSPFNQVTMSTSGLLKYERSWRWGVRGQTVEDVETGSTQNGFPCGSSFSDSALSCGCWDWCCCKFCNMGSSTPFLSQKLVDFGDAQFFSTRNPPWDSRCEQRCSVSEMTMRVGKVLHLGGLDPLVICLSKYHRYPLLLHGSFKYILLVVYHHNIYSMAISGS